MKPTQKTLIEHMAIHDMEIKHRKRLLALTPQDEQALAACRDWIEGEVAEIVETFYAHLTDDEEVVRVIGDADTLKNLKIYQKKYILDLFNGEYGLDYVNQRLRIGMTHKRIGVEPKFYLSAVRLLRELLADTLSAGLDPGVARIAVRALDKLLFFDTQFVVDTYIRSLTGEIEAAKEKVASYALDLEARVADRTRKLEELARRDSLTGLYNQRAFREMLRRDISRARRNHTPLSLAYLDVDKFKTINDTFGHQKGDEILKTVGAVLLDIVRDVDTPCRYGGDEFCLILSGATLDDAGHVCRRLFEAFSRQCPEVALSVGIAQTGPTVFLDAESLIKHADTLMYEAKKVEGFQMVTSARTQPEETMPS